MKNILYTIVVLLLIGFSSCSMININNLEKKLIEKDSNRIILSITTTYLPSKTVWYYTNDSIIIYKKISSRKDILRYSYGLENSLYNNQLLESYSVNTIEKEIYNKCGFELDGDELTVTLMYDANVIQKSYNVDISRFTTFSYENDFLNYIKNDISTFSLWP